MEDCKNCKNGEYGIHRLGDLLYEVTGDGTGTRYFKQIPPKEDYLKLKNKYVIVLIINIMMLISFFMYVKKG